jgi:hypothetical protein
MKIYSLLLFLTLNLFSSPAVVRENIGDRELVILKDSFTFYEDRGEDIKFYQKQQNHDLHYLLTHILHEEIGGCTGKGIEDGTYKIDGDKLILYSFWKRSGSVKDAPYGARIAQYHLDEDGELKLLHSEVYIEAHQHFNHDTSGMQFLFTAPKDDAQKAQLTSYIATIEHYYKGKFVLGDRAKQLISEVKEILKPKKKSVWKEYTSD